MIGSSRRGTPPPPRRCRLAARRFRAWPGALLEAVTAATPGKPTASQPAVQMTATVTARVTVAGTLSLPVPWADAAAAAANATVTPGSSYSQTEAGRPGHPLRLESLVFNWVECPCITLVDTAPAYLLSVS